MKTYNFGSAFGKKIVEVSEDKIVIKNKTRLFSEINISDVQAVFRSNPSKFGDGQVVFSYDGKAPEDLIVNKDSFTYNTSQESDVLEILETFEGIVVDIMSVGEQADLLAKVQLEQAKESLKESVWPKANFDKNKIACPSCGSVDVDFISNDKKGFSAGKAIGGALLTGGIGALAGFTGKKGKKNNWHCKNCGNTFTK